MRRTQGRSLTIRPVHNHYLAWNGDGTGVYAARGYLPYQMDIWRLSIDSSGAAPVRLTHHNARVSYPALLDANTLLYIATAADSAEQTLYTLDLPSRVAGGSLSVPSSTRPCRLVALLTVADSR